MKSILSFIAVVLPFFTYAQICTKYTLAPDTADVNVLTEFQVQEITGGSIPPELWVCNWIDFDNDNSHECISVNTCQHTFTTVGWHTVAFEINEPFLGNTAVCSTNVYVRGCNTGPVKATADALPDSVVRCAGTQLTLGLNAPSAAFCSGNWEYSWFDGVNYYDGTGFNSGVEVWSATYQFIPSGILQSTKNFKCKIRCSTSYSCTDSSSVLVKIQNVNIYNFTGGSAYCTGSSGTSDTLSGSQLGVSYQLMKNGNPEGMAIDGSGGILIWNNLTAGTYTVVAAYIASPNCTANMNGSVIITENPLPTVTQISNITVCPSTTINIGDFTGSPTGTTFTWTNSNIYIGLAASGIGNIPAWTGPPSSTGANIVGTIIVRPWFNGCQGAPMSFTVTITPTPAMNQKSNIIACPGSTINMGNFVSIPSGGTFEWTNSNTAIGIAANGTGNIASWTAPANNTGSDIAGTIAVTPSLLGCPGIPMSFTVTVKTAPVIYNFTGGSAYCVGGNGTSDTLSSSQPGVNYQLFKNGVSYGAVVAGTGSALIWNNLTAGTYMVVATSATAPYCTADMNGSIAITESPVLTVNAGSDQTIPYGTTTTLSATVTGGSGAYIYAWEPAALLVNPNAQTSLTNNINTITQFVLTVHDANTGCVNADSMYVFITGGPLNVTAIAQPLNVCGGDTVFLNALVSGGTGTYTYTWTSNPQGFNADSANPYTMPAVITEYVVSVNDGFNNASSSVNVTVRPQPQLYTLTGGGDFCSGTSGMNDTLSGSQLGVNYQLFKNSVSYGAVVAGTGSALVWTNLTAGTYTVMATYATAPHCSALMNGSVVINEKPVPTVTQISNISVCPGSQITIPCFTSTPVGATFTWTNSNTAIGMGASGIGCIPSWTAPANSPGTNIVGTIAVTPTLNGCPGTPMIFTVTIKPTPSIIQATSIAVCPGSQIVIPCFTSIPSGATYSWTNSNTNIGLAASGTGCIPSWTAPANVVGTSIVSNIIVTPELNGCTGTPMTFTVTIKPTPNVIPITNIVVCPGETIVIGNFVSSPAGASFAWTNSNTGIGLAASGSSNIPSWTAPVNNTGDNIIGTITVTPTLNGCQGPPMSFSVVIKPTPNILQMSNIAVCPDETIVIDNFVSLPVNGTFNWTNSNTAIGLAASGTGNIPSWTAPANNTGADITGTITVTSTLNGCMGSPMSFTVTIHAASVGGSISGNTSVCVGTPVTLTLNGYSGNIISWRKRLNNGTWTNITYTGTVYTETPSAAGVWEYYAVLQNLPCVANYSNTISVTVNATPQIYNFSGAHAYCVGSGGTSDTLNGSQPGVNYQLFKNGVSYGAVVAGTGSALIWNNLTAGTYMVVATYSASPYCVADMNGSVIIVEFSPPVVVAGNDTIIGNGGEVLLNAEVTGGSGSYSYYWMPESLVVNPTSHITTTLPLSNSTYFVVSVTDNLTACIDTDFVSVVVIGGQLSVSANILPSVVCLGDTAHLISIPSGGSGAYTYFWTSNPSGFTSNSMDTFDVPTVNTTYTITVEDGVQQAFASVSVVVSPPPVAYTLSGGGAYCHGSNGLIVSLSGSQIGVDYQLLKNGTNYGAVVAGTGNALIWSNLTAGIYSVVATYATAPYCSAGMNGNVDIVENPLPVVFAGYDQIIFSGATANLNVTVTGGSGHYSYQWTPAILVTNPTAQSTTTNPLVITQQFIVFVYDSVTTCTQSDTVNIIQFCCGLSVNATAQPNTICIGDTVHLNAIANGGSGSYTYTWTSIPPGFTSNIQNPVVFPTGTNQYIVVVNDGSQSATNAVNVVVNTPPDVNLGADTTLCLSQNIILTGTSGTGLTYIWIKLPDDTLAYTQSLYLDTAISGSGTATYILNVSDSCSNSDADTINITFDVCPFVFEQNALGISIFPNPAKDNVTIDWDKGLMSNPNIEIVDIYGRTIVNEMLTDKSNNISLQGFSTGVYFIRITSGATIYTSKLLIER